MLHNKYSPLPFHQGPRNKNNATIYLENLVKDILYAYRDNTPVEVSYNFLNETLFTMGNRFYNLAQLLKHQPDYDQIQFSQKDLAIYNSFLRDPKTAYGHIADDANPDELQAMQQAYPNMTLAEMSAIRHYTIDFYGAMNFLVKYYAAKLFPSLNDEGSEWALKGSLLKVASKVDPNYDPNNPNYDVNNPVFVTAAMREILFNVVFTMNALNKPAQDELYIFTASSLDALQNNFLQVGAISLVLIPKDNLHEVVMVAYGQTITQTPILIDLNNLLLDHLEMKDGIQLSKDEIEEITSQINNKDYFNSLNGLSSKCKTKLIDILTDRDEISALLYKEIYRVEEDADDVIKYSLPNIYLTVNTSQCFPFYRQFYSASAEILWGFASQDLNIVYKIINPIMQIKNIQTISGFFGEDERLSYPGQQFTYTQLEKGIDPYGQPVIYLSGYPIRSLDGIEYNETIGDQTPPEKSAATRTQPFFSDVTKWFSSSAKSATNFLYENLIEKPVNELGRFSEFYLEYLNNLTVEQIAMIALASNRHSLFHVSANVTQSLANEISAELQLSCIRP